MISFCRCFVLNKIWIKLCKKESDRFLTSIHDIALEQEKVLKSIIDSNCETDFGEKHSFKNMKTISDYREKVPITNYEDYHEEIERIKNGEENILTNDKVLMLELTSGSTDASKYIPYTKTLRDQFIKGINPWIFNLYTHIKELSCGTSYWSITPLENGKLKTKGGIPIGFEEDSQYFGWLSRIVVKFLFSVPAEVKYLKDIEAFRYTTLLFLLKDENLTLISVWNPSFLILLLSPMDGWIDKLLRDLEKGTIDPSIAIEDDLRKALRKKLGKNSFRVVKLKEIFYAYKNNFISKKTSVFELIWPNLKLISCWTHANAAFYIDELEKLFPNIMIQGKGLLATEGFVSFPYIGEKSPLLSIRSHFFEFEEVDDSFESTGNIMLSHEIEINKYYKVIITTAGGFYRYNLNDVIKVTGFTKKCPQIILMGRGSKVSDFCGEKLNEIHINSVMSQVIKNLKLALSFYMLSIQLQDTKDEKPAYVLFVEYCKNQKDENEDEDEAKYKYKDKYKDKYKYKDKDDLEKELFTFKNQVEEGLKENFHYKYCRQLEQLGALKVFLINASAGEKAVEIYQKVCQRLGQKLGNIKPSALHNYKEWSKEFNGHFITF